ncbi:MAG: hypothetical protein M3O82_01440 [Verrucomicrobiota bacterium]|nr:hypothetical protein [Verrucomicrobiota bacterium]
MHTRAAIYREDQFQVDNRSDLTHHIAMLVAYSLVAIGVLYRVILCTAVVGSPGWLANFSPLAAIAFCGALYLPKRHAILLPLVTLLVSDVIIDLRAGVSLLPLSYVLRYAALATSAWLGFVIRSRPNLGKIFAGSLAGSAIFYLLSNTGAWIGSPDYAQNLAGWWQSMTTGVPGYAPSWIFFRNTLVGDLLFTLLFVACMSITWSASPELSEAKSAGAIKR